MEQESHISLGGDIVLLALYFAQRYIFGQKNFKEGVYSRLYTLVYKNEQKERKIIIWRLLNFN